MLNEKYEKAIKELKECQRQEVAELKYEKTACRCGDKDKYYGIPRVQRDLRLLRSCSF